MSQEYSRAALRVALAQICQNLGWNSIQTTPLELLTDVLERYMTSLGVYAHRYSEQFGRVEPTLDDMALAFQEMGVNLNECVDYLKHVDPLPFAFDVPQYPVPRPNLLGFPKPNSRELYEREEHVSDHYPSMHPGWEDEIMANGDAADDVTVHDVTGESSGAEKRGAATPVEGEPASKRLRSQVLPEEALPSSYEMKGVLMSEKGLPIGQGKLPEPMAPPPPTPTTTMVQNPLFKTPSLPQETEGGAENKTSPVMKDIDVEEDDEGKEEDVPSVVTETVAVETKTEPIVDQPVVTKSPRGRPPKSASESPIVTTPKSIPDGKPKKRGRPAKGSPKPSLKIPETGTVSKSPGRPPKSPSLKPKKSPGRPPKSPVGRPPKSPMARSPGRPPKSPLRLGGAPRSPGRSPGRSPLSSPLSPKSPAVHGRGKSPSKASKSPGRAPGRPPKSPGRGRPPKSPIRSPGGVKEAGGPKSPIREYLLTGEPPIGKPPPTKAQLKMQPMQSPPRGRKPSAKSAKRSESIQKLDFEKARSPVETASAGVISETVEVSTVTEKAPTPIAASTISKLSDKLKKPTSLSEKIDAVLSSGALDDDDEENDKKSETDGASSRQKEREEQLRQEILKKDRIRQERERIERETREPSDSPSGRVTPDWIKTQAAQLKKEVKLKEERQSKDLPPFSPATEIKSERVASPKPEKEKTKSKKEKKKNREKKKHRDESGEPSSKSLEKQAKKERKAEERKAEERKAEERKAEERKAEERKQEEKKFEERLREKLRESSISSSSPERSSVTPSGGGDASVKAETSIQPLRIGIGNKQFTIKPMAEDSDKETKKKNKKNKKKKDKEKDKDQKSDSNREEKKEKSKKDKKRDKEKSKKREEAEEPSLLPKLKFKLGGAGVTVTPTESPRASPKRDIPKLVIKQREDSPDKRVFTKRESPPPPSRSTSSSPPHSYSPPPRRRSPTPPLLKTTRREPLNLSPVRFTPSPDSNPKTPSMNSPFHHPSPTYSRHSRSPSLPRGGGGGFGDYKMGTSSSRERSLSPMKTPTMSRASPSPPHSHHRRSLSHSPSPAPPTSKGASDDVIPPLPPTSAQKGKKGKAGAAGTAGATAAGETKVIAETQGTIIGENGEIIWICPACASPDDGSPMIGCDVCDDWYHWACMGITQEPPDDESWYCPKHRSREPPKRTPSKGTPRGRGRGRGRKKKV